MAWSELTPAAQRFRIVHAAWSIAGLASLGYLWTCALVRRRDPALASGITFLVVEGVALAIGGGDCPMATKQRAWGDPKPFFELVLPPRAAKAAVPLLFGASLVGLIAVALRPPRPRRDVYPVPQTADIGPSSGGPGPAPRLVYAAASVPRDELQAIEPAARHDRP
ncbi:MAG TPA: hypothetical protein VID26_02925 [Candidatus Limnocylindrales bacterium]|jgi:hypothetical protein